MELIFAMKVVTVALSVICFIVTLVVMFVLNSGGLIKTTMQPFDLQDRTLMFPFIEDTISGPNNVIVNSVCILLLGACWSFSVLGHRSLQAIKRMHWMFILQVELIIIYGGLVTNTITNIIKHYRGGLRPHFLVLCKPNATIVNELAVNKTTWVDLNLTKVICTSQEKLDYRWSFPSGHSSTAMYGMFLCVLLLQYISLKQQLYMVKGFLQMCCLAFGLWVCCSRLVDYHHQWWDVLAGGILGVLIAWATYYWFLQQLKRTFEEDSLDNDKEAKSKLEIGSRRSYCLN